MDVFNDLIGGEWVAADDHATFETRNPAHDDEVLGVFPSVGTGEALNEIATGAIVEWPDFKERFARLRESVKLMRELWWGEYSVPKSAVSAGTLTGTWWWWTRA